MQSTRIARFAILVLPMAVIANAQQISPLDRDTARMMLDRISSDLRKNYYDPSIHGIEWDAKVNDAKQRIGSAMGLNMAFGNIAAALDSLNDSHTFFLPPPQSAPHDYGLQLQMIGERCFISQVRPQTDAESKGIKPGDEVLLYNGYRPTRETLWKMEYFFNALRPGPAIHLVLKSPGEAQRELDVLAEIRHVKALLDLSGPGATFDAFELIRESENEQKHARIRAAAIGDDLMVLRLPGFLFEQSQVDAIMGNAKKHKALIIDLRQNPGGSVEGLRHLLGGFFDHEIKIGDRVSRHSTKPIMTRSFQQNYFPGKLLVLVDSKSASASELFARVVQLEKRGTVIGDHTSGSVMEAVQYHYKIGMDRVMPFGASITDADILMTDGASLEHTGVLPDEILLPSPADLVDGHDPVLARAAELCGVKLSAEEAGKLFPYEWAKR